MLSSRQIHQNVSACYIPEILKEWVCPTSITNVLSWQFVIFFIFIICWKTHIISFVHVQSAYASLRVRFSGGPPCLVSFFRFITFNDMFPLHHLCQIAEQKLLYYIMRMILVSVDADFHFMVYFAVCVYYIQLSGLLKDTSDEKWMDE